MDHLKGVWHGLVFVWPAKMILDKGEEKDSVLGQIKFVDSEKDTKLSGEINRHEGILYITLNTNKHKYIGIIQPDGTRITGTRLQNDKNPCQFVFLRK